MENTSNKAMAQMLRDALARQQAPTGKFWGVVISTELCKELVNRLEKLDRLAKYEDTGLTPEEIATMEANLRQIEEEKARQALVVDMVDLAAHAIGMNNRKTYKRHGKTWYKPYRNYYCAGSQGDPVWEEMVKQGYASKSKGLSSVYYFVTRAGLDWLGEQTCVNIHDEEG